MCACVLAYPANKTVLGYIRMKPLSASEEENDDDHTLIMMITRSQLSHFQPQLHFTLQGICSACSLHLYSSAKHVCLILFLACFVGCGHKSVYVLLQPLPSHPSLHAACLVWPACRTVALALAPTPPPCPFPRFKLSFNRTNRHTTLRALPFCCPLTFCAFDFYMN